MLRERRARGRGKAHGHCPGVRSLGPAGGLECSLHRQLGMNIEVWMWMEVSLFTGERPWEWGRGSPVGIKEWALF